MRSFAAALLHGLKQNVLAGFRLGLFLRVRPLDFRVSAEDYAALLIFNLAVWLAGSMLRGGFPGSLNYAALPVALMQIPLVLVTGLILSRLFRRPELLLAFALLLVSTDVLFEIAGTAINVAITHEWITLPPWGALAINGAYLGWALASVLRAQFLLTGWRPPRSYAAGAVLTALFLLVTFGMPRAEIWQGNSGDDDESGEPQVSIAQEEVFHAQTPLLINQLDQLEPERPGVADLYFLGLAPFGTQHVFARELASVEELFEERFDAAGRSMVLSNNPATLEEIPIATVTHLRLALARIAAVMNPDEDVLFLYITTHGSQSHELAFELPPLELNQLTPAALARMLQDAGIKWRVLVISACYSGGFIEPLKDDNTLIITASAADRQSFGCASENDFTHFGRAYFDEALRKTFSFTEAFTLARAAIAARERAGKLVPSNPQMHLGASMGDKLAALEQRFKERANIKQVRRGNLRLVAARLQQLPAPSTPDAAGR